MLFYLFYDIKYDIIMMFYDIFGVICLIFEVLLKESNIFQ